MTDEERTDDELRAENGLGRDNHDDEHPPEKRRSSPDDTMHAKGKRNKRRLQSSTSQHLYLHYKHATMVTFSLYIYI